MRGSPGVRFADNYRTIPETRILEMLLLAGWAYEQENPEAIVRTRQALEKWIDLGLGFRAGPAGERLFDPVEVVNVLKRLGLEGRDSFWADRYIHTGRRLVTDLVACAEQSFVVDFKRTFSLRQVPLGKALRLRAPLPLVSVYGDSLNIAPFVEASSNPWLGVSEGRLETRLTAGDGPVTLGARLSFSGKVPSPRGAPQLDLEPYLKPREGLIVVTDRVNALAHAMAGPGADRASVVSAFWTYMMDEMNCGAIHYDQIHPNAPCDWALEAGWYDCQLGSALFIALCRARGIPARLVGGHVLYRRAPTNHYWAEVWFEETGWMPFDFLSWDLSLGGHDPQWRDHFRGWIDNRMITQLLPFKFTGALGVVMPDPWQIIQTANDEGIEISLVAANGEPIYSDCITISG